ncbi:uncharacterized protein LOC135212827 [Macrobrachium nipponense]|uniref:uncharacterized protein LOC135212827 n=1 Tax=Macrobrachium nipponense TaxID=159736 RepID=UPI0030C7CA83
MGKSSVYLQLHCELVPRCLQWIRVINIKCLLDKSTKYVKNCCRVCSLHFSCKNYVTPDSSRLNKNACPDQNLAGNPNDTSAAPAITYNSECSTATFESIFEKSGTDSCNLPINYDPSVRPSDIVYDLHEFTTDLVGDLQFSDPSSFEAHYPKFFELGHSLGDKPPQLVGNESDVQDASPFGPSVRLLPENNTINQSITPQVPVEDLTVDVQITECTESDSKSDMKQPRIRTNHYKSNQKWKARWNRLLTKVQRLKKVQSDCTKCKLPSSVIRNVSKYLKALSCFKFIL